MILFKSITKVWSMWGGIFVKHSISANFSIINDKNNGKAAHSLNPIATFIEVTMLTAQVLIFVRSDASEQ